LLGQNGAMTLSHSELKRYTEANRAAWNEVMPMHQRAAKEKWDRLFAQPGFVRLSDLEIGLLQKIGIRGKNVAHLCCNNGVELLSLKNLGAAECIGFDISDEAISEARERAAQCGIDCGFVRSDVYEIGEEYNGRFDLVYISVGCFGWMPDLNLFFKKAAALLRKDGIIFIHEIHPFFEMLPVGKDQDAGSLRITGPYFKAEPYAEQGGLDYVGNSEYPATSTEYWFVHTLSDIIMGMIDNGVGIEHFSEYPTAVSPDQHQFEEANAGIPLSLVLLGRMHAAS
jgi:SAM-dependent methyltransferase